MGTTADKLARLNETKALLKQRLVEKRYYRSCI